MISRCGVSFIMSGRPKNIRKGSVKKLSVSHSAPSISSISTLDEETKDERSDIASSSASSRSDDQKVVLPTTTQALSTQTTTVTLHPRRGPDVFKGNRAWSGSKGTHARGNAHATLAEATVEHSARLASQGGATATTPEALGRFAEPTKTSAGHSHHRHLLMLDEIDDEEGGEAGGGGSLQAQQPPHHQLQQQRQRKQQQQQQQQQRWWLPDKELELKRDADGGVRRIMHSDLTKEKDAWLARSNDNGSNSSSNGICSMRNTIAKGPNLSKSSTESYDAAPVKV
jgi:hypothetical protein